MIQILPENQGGFGASFGQALGQGVSQQLPEEIKRYRLKSGLENLASMKDTNENNLLSRLITIPGMDAQTTSLLYPVILQQLQRKEQDAEGNAQAIDENLPQNRFDTNLQQGQTNFHQNASSPQGMTRPSSLNQTGLNFTPQGSQSPKETQQNQIAHALLRNEPLRFKGDFDKAISEQERLKTELDTDLKEAFSQYLQKGPELQAGEIGGDVIHMMNLKAHEYLAEHPPIKGKGHSTKTIANEFARRGKEIGKKFGDLRKQNNDIGIINQPSQKSINGIRDTNEDLEKLGVPQSSIVDNNVKAFGIPRGEAEYLVDPLYDTKAGKLAHRLEDKNGFLNNVTKRIAPLELKLLNRSSKYGSPEAKAAAEIGPLITPRDLIGSLAKIVSEKGYDSDLFLSELKKHIPSNILTLDQSSDLNNQALIPKIKSLKSGWLFGWSGENKKAREVK